MKKSKIIILSIVAYFSLFFLALNNETVGHIFIFISVCGIIAAYIWLIVKIWKNDRDNDK